MKRQDKEMPFRRDFSTGFGYDMYIQSVSWGVRQDGSTGALATCFSNLSREELEEQITELAGQLNAANYRWLTLIAEFDRRSQPESGHVLSSSSIRRAPWPRRFSERPQARGPRAPSRAPPPYSSPP